MKLDVRRVKICVTAPSENIDAIREAVCKAGAGVIGNYDFCSDTSKVLGTFRPNENAEPYIGENGKVEFVDEERLEVSCKVNKVRDVLTALRAAHPYEEPAIDILPLLDEKLWFGP